MKKIILSLCVVGLLIGSAPLVKAETLSLSTEQIQQAQTDPIFKAEIIKLITQLITILQEQLKIAIAQENSIKQLSQNPPVIQYLPAPVSPNPPVISSPITPVSKAELQVTVTPYVINEISCFSLKVIALDSDGKRDFVGSGVKVLNDATPNQTSYIGTLNDNNEVSYCPSGVANITFSLRDMVKVVTIGN